MTLIGLSSMKLATDTYASTWADSPNAVFAFYVIDNFFTASFIIEMVVKFTAIVMNEGTYLRDNWNRLDFFIVITSIIKLEF